MKLELESLLEVQEKARALFEVSIWLGLRMVVDLLTTLEGCFLCAVEGEKWIIKNRLIIPQTNQQP